MEMGKKTLLKLVIEKILIHFALAKDNNALEKLVMLLNQLHLYERGFVLSNTKVALVSNGQSNYRTL